MKKILFVVASVIIAFGISAIQQKLLEQQKTPHQASQLENIISPTAAATAQQAAPEQPEQAVPEPDPPSTTASRATTCREAIDQTWPLALRDGAKLVLVHENRAENPLAEGAINSDGVNSQDFGCFQINNYWHAQFFRESDWRDPVANAEYAYKIFQGRQQSEGNGWRAWYAVRGILW